jgi:hypothetical protein
MPSNLARHCYGFFASSLRGRRSATSQESAIQVGTPKYGSTHFCSANQPAMKSTGGNHSGIYFT